MKVNHPVQQTVGTDWKILVIDDNEADFILVKEMLQRAKGRKVEVEWASSYQAGCEALHADHFNAVLVDDDLGSRTGLQLIRAVNRHGYASPLILFAGRESNETDIEARQAGATLYLTKSEANPVLLERLIHYAIELKQKEQALRDHEAQLRQLDVALRVSEERFHKSFNASPNAQVISRKADGIIEIVNDRFEHLFGYRRDEVIGKTSLELNLFTNPADREVIMRSLDEDENLRDHEITIRTKLGQVRRVALSVENLVVDNVALILTVIEDITEREQAEAALEDSEARFRALIQATSQVLYRMSPDWSEMRQLLGGNFLADTLKPNANWMAEYIHPDDQTWVGEVINKAVQTGSVFDLEHRVLRADGTIGWTVSRAVPIRDAEREIIEWFGAARDITERKKIENELKQSEDLLEAFFSNSPSILNIVDENLCYLKTANLTPAFFGLDRQSIVGKAIKDLAPEYFENYAPIMKRVLATGKAERWEVQFPVYGSEGKKTDWQASFFSIPLPEGKTGLGIIGVEITAQKKAEAEKQEQAIQIEVQRRLMDQRERDRNAIARDIHDGPIQNLSSTLFHLQIIHNTFPEAALQKELQRVGMDIQSTISELREVLVDLRPPALITFGFSKVLQSYIKDLRKQFSNLEIKLDAVKDDTLLSDQTHLTLFRIFQAGINNIIRHSNASKIWIVYRLEADHFYLELRDDGAGFVLKKDLSHLARSGHFGLIGMRERAEAIGAELSVSTQPGGGTTILVKGPLNAKNLK